MKHTNTIILAAVAVLWSLPVLALDLQTGRENGDIGEKNDGYVQAMTRSPEAIDLADQVNIKRRAEYVRISKENGQSVAVVGKLAAGQIVDNLPKGAKYQDAAGNWKVR